MLKLNKNTVGWVVMILFTVLQQAGVLPRAADVGLVPGVAPALPCVQTPAAAE